MAFFFGVIAQLVERFNGIEEVVSSILIGSTIFFHKSPAKPRKKKGFAGFFVRYGVLILVRKNIRNRPCLLIFKDF